MHTYIQTYITYSTGDLVMKDDVSGIREDADAGGDFDSVCVVDQDEDRQTDIKDRQTDIDDRQTDSKDKEGRQTDSRDDAMCVDSAESTSTKRNRDASEQDEADRQTDNKRPKSESHGQTGDGIRDSDGVLNTISSVHAASVSEMDTKGRARGGEVSLRDRVHVVTQVMIACVCVCVCMNACVYVCLRGD
jgi:hypothetical protein